VGFLESSATNEVFSDLWCVYICQRCVQGDVYAVYWEMGSFLSIVRDSIRIVPFRVIPINREREENYNRNTCG
jgi:hypothetical protein